MARESNFNIAGLKMPRTVIKIADPNLAGVGQRYKETSPGRYRCANAQETRYFQNYKIRQLGCRLNNGNKSVS